jgi:hypothetical protein
MGVNIPADLSGPESEALRAVLNGTEDRFAARVFVGGVWFSLQLNREGAPEPDAIAQAFPNVKPDVKPTAKPVTVLTGAKGAEPLPELDEQYERVHVPKAVETNVEAES